MNKPTISIKNEDFDIITNPIRINKNDENFDMSKPINLHKDKGDIF